MYSKASYSGFYLPSKISSFLSSLQGLEIFQILSKMISRIVTSRKKRSAYSWKSEIVALPHVLSLNNELKSQKFPIKEHQVSGPSFFLILLVNIEKKISVLEYFSRKKKCIKKLKFKKNAKKIFC